MGQKVSPIANRLGYIEDWESKWFNFKEMPGLIEEDFFIRKYIRDKEGRGAGISKIMIERTGKILKISIYTARPGIIIGRRGQEIENLRSEIENIVEKKTFINVLEIKEPALDAQLVADSIAIQLEKNLNYRRVIKRAIERTMSCGAGGIKVMISGRIGGIEIARSEWFKEGRIPTNTFRANIHFAKSEALIKKGKIGIKVWIFKGELFRKTDKDLLKEKEAQLIETEKIKQFEELPSLDHDFIEEVKEETEEKV